MSFVDCIDAPSAAPLTDLKILSLDGGDMQGLGLSSLLILKELMATIALLEVKENDSAADHPTDGAGQLPLPCHYFDYIFGDGEGGLIAVMLGRLRMDVDLCIHEYRILSPDIYKPHSGFLRFTINPDRGRAEVLEKTLRARRSLQPFEYFRQSDENQCRTVVVAVRRSNIDTQPFLMRSYDHPQPQYRDPLVRNPGMAWNSPIWKAVSVSLASDFMSTSMEINGSVFDFAKSIYSLVDPVILAFREVSQMNRISGPKGDSFSTHCLRIGRGIHRPSCISELEQLASRGSPGKYHNPTKEDRFTSEHYPGYHQLLGICEEISIKSTRGSAHEPLLEMVEQLTTEYLQAKQVQDKIKELARILVETRRSRLRERNWPNTNTKAFYGILTSPKTSEKDCPIQPHELVSFPSDSSSNAEIVALESGYETKPQTGSEPARYEVDPSLIMNEYSVNQNNWEKIREILPYVLRKGMSFDKGVWSFICDPTSYMYIRDIDVPLRIAGAPVIVLVYSPSFEIPDTSALVPDPYTSEIDPCDEIPAGFICCLFNTYPFALYFYVFCSGHLQIGVDSPFDYLTSSTKYPRTFGGFKVSFFTNGPVATSNSGPSAARRTSGISLRRGGEVEIGDSSHGHQTTRFRAGLAVKMDGDGIRRKDGTDGGGCFITIPTHGAIAPAKVAGHGPISRIISRLFSGLRRGPLQLIGTVVYGTAQGGLGDRTRIGPIEDSFDPIKSASPSHNQLFRKFPCHLKYDVSLVRPDNPDICQNFNLGCPKSWYKTGPLDTRNKVRVIGDPHNVEGQALPRASGMSIGRGIFKIQKDSNRPRDKLKDWKFYENDITSLVDRCHIWRPQSYHDGWNGWSGAPVVVQQNYLPGSPLKEEILGFQSFVQLPCCPKVGSVPSADDCAQGLVSFAACFELPDGLIRSKII